MEERYKAKEQLINEPVEAYPGVLVVHLNGKKVSHDVQQLMKLVLERIVETNSLVAVVDMTGVPTIDTETAQNLINAIGAVRLLGTQVILAGAHPAITQTLTRLSDDHFGIAIRSSLAVGLWVALDIVESQVANSTSRGEVAKDEDEIKEQLIAEDNMAEEVRHLQIANRISKEKT